MKKNILSCSKLTCAFFVLFCLVFLVYSNSFDCSWHFDDEHNILKNPKIHVKNLYPQEIFNTFSASIAGGSFSSDKIYRPVSMFSFALNWYFGQDSVFGYHIVNTFIHFLCSFFLFFSVLLLFQTPNIKNKFSEKFIYNCALVTSCLWAVHPINVQAVTYIVQRMASLAAMFYILAFFLYLKGRLSHEKIKQFFFFSLCVISFLLSIGSKENTALFPLMILIVELIFFHDPIKIISNKKIMITFFIGFFFFSFLLFNVFLNNKFPSFSGRSFTLSERLLTESRILIKYLFQLFYPSEFQFSIEHSISISRSLFKPVTTFISLFLIFLLIIFSIVKARKHPFFSFAVFFFFINHIVESSIIPLELIFEHRNYLPSMFLFLPLVIAFLKLLDFFKKKRVIYSCLNIFLALSIFAIGMGTYSRNFDWKTPAILWADAADKAPNNARPLQNLSFYYYEKNGLYDKAIILHEKALELEDNSPVVSKASSYLNLSNLYLKKGNISRAVFFAEKAYETKPDLLSGKNFVKILLSGGNYKEAEIILESLYKKYNFDTEVLNLRTYIFLMGNKFYAAYKNALISVKESPFDKMSLKMFAFSCFVTGQHKKADYYLRKSLNNNPDEKIVLALSLIQNSINAKQFDRSSLYIKKLLENFDINSIKAFFESSDKHSYSYLNLSYEYIASEISDLLQNESDDFNKMKF